MAMDRELRSAKLVKFFWAIKKVTLLFRLCVLLSLSVAMYGRAAAPNLSGTWTLPDGTIITMMQRGTRIEGRITAPSSYAQTEGGYERDDIMLEGVISEGKLVGKAYVRFPISMRNECP